MILYCATASCAKVKHTKEKTIGLSDNNRGWGIAAGETEARNGGSSLGESGFEDAMVGLWMIAITASGAIESVGDAVGGTT